MIVNTSCSNLHSLCATGVSSGLAARMSWTQVSWPEAGRVYYLGGGGTTGFIFISRYAIVVRFHFKWYTRISNLDTLLLMSICTIVRNALIKYWRLRNTQVLQSRREFSCMKWELHLQSEYILCPTLYFLQQSPLSGAEYPVFSWAWNLTVVFITFHLC
jgi:hypothetical protein